MEDYKPKSFFYSSLKNKKKIGACQHVLAYDLITLAAKRMIGLYAITCQHAVQECSIIFIESRGMLHNISFCKSNGSIIRFLSIRKH
jgi:hypothetical protein